jgi:murein DD-endopeptidase MepM/ murein hydrolase activator NlpD
MELGRPLKANYIIQKFGLENTNPNMLKFYQSFGLKGHNGWDFICKDKDPLYFNCLDYEGEVIELSYDRNAGIGIVVGVRTPRDNFKLIYWHLDRIEVRVGQKVSTGQLLGHNDNTGYSTGTHLHFGLKKCDENFNTLDRDNGYRGAISPEPYYKNVYVKELVDTQLRIIKVARKVIVLLKIAIGLK